MRRHRICEGLLPYHLSLSASKKMRLTPETRAPFRASCASYLDSYLEKHMYIEKNSRTDTFRGHSARPSVVSWCVRCHLCGCVSALQIVQLRQPQPGRSVYSPHKCAPVEWNEIVFGTPAGP